MSERAAKDALFDGFAEVAKALASGRRTEIVDVLAQGKRSVDAIAAEIGQSVANTSHHLRALAASRIAHHPTRGTPVFYRLGPSERVLHLFAIERAAEHVAGLERLADDHLGPRDRTRLDQPQGAGRRLRRHDRHRARCSARHDFASGHIAWRRSIPIGRVARTANELPNGVDVVAYCRGPSASTPTTPCGSSAAAATAPTPRRRIPGVETSRPARGGRHRRVKPHGADSRRRHRQCRDVSSGAGAACR